MIPFVQHILSRLLALLAAATFFGALATHSVAWVKPPEVLFLYALSASDICGDEDGDGPRGDGSCPFCRMADAVTVPQSTQAVPDRTRPMLPMGLAWTVASDGHARCAPGVPPVRGPPALI